jgi:hypothetical protein
MYAAFDPELDRRVALEVLEGAVRGPHAPLEEGGASRLLRERLALAKLAHPNVVAIHEATAALTGIERARSQFLEARLLWQMGHARPRALALAGTALEAFEKAGHERHVAEVVAWLAAPVP